MQFGSPVAVGRAFEDYVSATVIDGLGASEALTLSFIAARATFLAEPRGDALVTGGSNYTIREVINDGTGMTTLMLEAD